jgi:hypothetical protein
MKHPKIYLAPLFALPLLACGGVDDEPATAAQATAALSASATPATVPRGPGRFFARLDQNGDGRITQAEAGAERWQHLSRADTNHDGAVTRAELEAARPHDGGRGGGQMFARLDANQDGKLVASEVPAEVWAHISVADADGDGAVTRDELRQAHEQGRIQPPPRRPQR